jgi:PmbA protein
MNVDSGRSADAAALERLAGRALALLREHGFEHAQATASRTTKDEVNIAHNEPSLMRSTELAGLALTGIAAGRRAACELTDLGEASVAARVRELRDEAAAVPPDPAYAVSADERARIVQGPQAADLDRIAEAARQLLAFRARETPAMMVDECFFAHNRVRSHTATSGGSALSCSVGWYEVSVFGTAREGKAVSSFAYTGGSSDDLDGRVEHRFGIAELLRDTVRQVRVRPLGAKFTGEVVLTPPAVADLVEWLLGQLGDVQLIAGTSLYRGAVGERIAAPALSLRSRFDAPGVAAVSADGFAAPPVEVLREGRLLTLLPSLYGSRKTGLPHVPVAAAGGWEMPAGDADTAALIGGVARGALVGRLSMGRPAANGDFAGVIKNSFAIDRGEPAEALSETMISGNVARMLDDVVAASRERLDTGAWLLPSLRVGGLHFS